eukprot:m.72945 g.72945  ORF g.72945 m.72945 type:complete len:957 (+) comp13011_c1_seq1:158-3028(+)
MDEFEQTVLALNNPESTADLRSQALALFDQYKRAGDAWVVCARNFVSGFYQEEITLSACVQVIEAVVQERIATLDEPHRVFLRDFLRAWLQDKAASPAQSAGIRNKMAHLFALVFAREFPAAWPSFFQDISAAVTTNAPLADFFLRVMLAIDEEVVDRDIERTSDATTHNSGLKDSMRLVMATICEAWHGIITTYGASSPAITGTCLRCISLYTAWIDISFVAHERFLTPIFQFFETPTPELRDGACDCLAGLVNKGMPPQNKIQLIRSLQIPERLSLAKASLRDNTNDFLLRLARLCNNTAIATLSALTKLTAGTTEHSEALALLEQIVQLILSFFNSEDNTVSDAVAEFVRDYLHYLKLTGLVLPVQRDDVQNILQISVMKMKYDANSFDFNEPDEEEEAFLQYRENLKTIVCNIAQLDSGLVLAFGRSVAAALDNPALSFTDLEVAVHYIFILGEALPGPHLTEGSSMVLEPLVGAVIASAASAHTHSAVLSEYFEVVARFHRYLSLHVEHIPTVLNAFLSRGLCHPSPALRSRAAYQFLAVVRVLTAHLRPYVSMIFAALAPLLAPDASRKILPPADQLSLYEAAGYLATVESLAPQEKLQLFVSLLTPLLDRYTTIISRDLATARDIRTQDQYFDFLSFAISAFTRISKGIPSPDALDACGCRPLFERAAECFIAGLRLARIRGDIFTFLHRLAVLLGVGFLPVLPSVLDVVATLDDRLEVMKVFVQLLNQVVSKHRDASVAVLVRLLPTLFTLVFGLLRQSYDEADPNTRADVLELRRSWFLFIHTTVAANASAALVAPETQPFLNDLMMLEMEGCQTADPQSQKLCVLVFRRLVQLWIGPQGSTVPGFADFVFSHVIPGCMRGCFDRAFNLGDSQTWLVLTEVTNFLRTVYERLGAPCLEYLNLFLPTLPLHPTLVRELLEGLQRPENPQDRGALAKLLKSVITRSRMS